MKKTILLFILLASPSAYSQGCPKGQLQFAFNDLSIRSAFALIADFGEVKLYLDSSIGGSQPIKFGCTPWQEAAKNIAKRNDLKINISQGKMSVSK